MLTFDEKSGIIALYIGIQKIKEGTSVMNTKIMKSLLTPDAVCLVRGKVSSSCITKAITDSERNELNKSRQISVDKNCPVIILYDAAVLNRDAAKPTIEEKYAAESIHSNNFTAISISKDPPRVAVIDADEANTYNEIKPLGELAPGLDVTLVMKAVIEKNGSGVLSLDRLLINEPIRYAAEK